MTMHDPAEPRPITAAYYYRVKWGHHEEWLDLFRRNHWPVLREQLRAGRFTDVRLFEPRYHGDGRADWDVMVTITYRDWAAMEATARRTIKLRLFPDQERFRAEEARRFELLEAHWDVPLTDLDLPLGVSEAPRPDPVLGFYGPDSRMWRINREAVLLGAGPAATLLQVAHPLIAEGVAQHSDFQVDPFGRLRRTLGTTMALVFGDGPTAERALRRLNGVHASVRGPVTDPTCARVTGAAAYRALDPELLLWVQATLIVTSVRAYRAWVGPLSEADADGFWSEARSVGTRMGIPLRVSPADWPALMAYWDRMLAPNGPIQVTGHRASAGADAGAAATAAGTRLGRRPPGTAGHGPAAAPDPRRLRHPMGLATRAVGTADRSRRPTLDEVVPAWRSMPQARAADRRARATCPDGRSTRPARERAVCGKPPERRRLPGAAVRRRAQPDRYHTRTAPRSPNVPDTDLSRRAVVTGMGAVTPIGNDYPTFWQNLVAGVSGGGPITHFDPSAV